MTHIPVSAIIPTFNRASYLGAAIDAVLSGTVVPAEILVLDDGSTDQTGEILRGYGSRIRHEWQANSGKSAALNRALAITEQPFIWIMDDDDLAEPDGLEKLFAALSGDPQAGFAYGSYTVFSDDEHTAEKRAVLAPNPDAETFHLDQLEGSSVLQPAMLVRRACYRQVGPFDTRLLRSQDYDMLLRLSRAFGEVRVPDAVFRQRQHDGARGTASLQRRPTASVLLWRQFNQIIFRRIHATYALEEYLAPADRSSKALRHRALVRRAGLMGRNGLWDLGLDDLVDAANCDEQELTSADIRLVNRAFAHRIPGTAAPPARRMARIVRSYRPDSRDRLLPLVQALEARRWRERVAALVGIIPGAPTLARKLIGRMRS